jgi:hypothetical protein
MSSQYRLVQSGKTTSGGCSAGQVSSEPVAPRIFYVRTTNALLNINILILMDETTLILCTKVVYVVLCGIVCIVLATGPKVLRFQTGPRTMQF